jgi:chromosome segregation ATPase
MVNEFRQAMVALEERLDRRFEHIDARFLQIESRFTQIDARFTQIDARFTQIEARFTHMDGRIDAIDAKMSRQFVWLVGLFVTIAITMVGAVMSVVSSALAR